MPSEWENVATASLTLLALGLLVVALRSYAHTRSRRLALIAVAFGLFAAKGIVLSFGLFQWTDAAQRLLLPMLLLDWVILLALSAAVFLRSET